MKPSMGRLPTCRHLLFSNPVGFIAAVVIVVVLSLQVLAIFGSANTAGKSHATPVGFFTWMYSDVARGVRTASAVDSAFTTLENEESQEEREHKAYKNEKNTLKREHHALKREQSRMHSLEKEYHKLSKRIRLARLDARRKASMEHELKADDRALKEMTWALKLQRRMQGKEKHKLQDMRSLMEEEDGIRKQQKLALTMHNMPEFQELKRQHDHLAQKIHHEEADMAQEVRKIALSQIMERRLEKSEQKRLAHDVSEVAKLERSQSKLKEERQLIDKAKKLANKERVDLHEAEKLMNSQRATLQKERDALRKHNIAELKKLEKSEQKLDGKIRKDEQDAKNQLQKWEDIEKHETEIAKSIAHLTRNDKTLLQEPDQQHKAEEQDAKERGVLTKLRSREKSDEAWSQRLEAQQRALERLVPQP